MKKTNKKQKLILKLGRGHILSIILLVLLSLLIQWSLLHAASADAKKVRVAIFPFNDIEAKTFDMNIPAILKAELSRHEFIETVPVEIVKNRLYEIEPSFLWTEKKGAEKRGGILWRIEPKVVEEVKRRVSADSSIYGDLTRFRSKWRIDTYILEGSDQWHKMSFTTTGYMDEEIPDRLAEMAKEIANWLRRENILDEAEEDIRVYRGGLYTYTTVIERIEKLVNSFPESVPLRALLLDLYLKEKQKYQDEVIRVGLKIIALYDPSREEDIRYLLSLSIDPFETTAEGYEKRGELENAIDIRNKALKLFPYRVNNHKFALGRNHYLLALSLEKRGEKGRASDNYRQALIYLPPSSEDFIQAKEGFKRLKDIPH